MSIHQMTDKQSRYHSADFSQAVGANSKVIEAGEKSGVSTYIYIPCIVYGEGSGFGNRISIQTVAIVRAAKALRQVLNIEGAGVSDTFFNELQPGSLLTQHTVLASMPH
jgi:hypothetical protein